MIDPTAATTAPTPRPTSPRDRLPRTRAAALACLMIALTFTLGGCETVTSVKQMLGADDINSEQLLAEADEAYDKGEYVTAYQTAIRVANREGNPDRYLAAYIAGMSQLKLRDYNTTTYYLNLAKQSPDPQLAADAQAGLGLFYADWGSHRKAITELLAAAPKLTGNDRANAYLFAAISQQKIGQRANARTNLLLAQRYATAPSLKNQIDQMIGVTGYTLQTGAFTKETNARQAAQELATKARPLNLGKARILVINRDGKRFYRVQVGQFASTESANQARNALNQSTGLHAIITPLSAR